jgi:two-component system OmpR family sensor kinase
VKLSESLQARLALSIGLILTAMWLLAAGITTVIVRLKIGEVFDAALRETAERILPLAVSEILAREDDRSDQRLAPIREHVELFTYIVRDATDRTLLSSHAADLSVFPVWSGPGFLRTETHRLYGDEAIQGSIRIVVAEPLAHRAAVARDVLLGLGFPLLILLPAALVAIVLAVRTSLGSLRSFRTSLEARGVRDLTSIPAEGLPMEIRPLAATLNAVLARLRSAFEAERNFAANAAHELRTPLAGAIAQIQRLRLEASDQATLARTAEIESTLRRLTRLAERLLQLARAEGGELRLATTVDLRIVVRLVVDDFARAAAPDRISLDLPGAPVVSDLDPDIFGILCRNLIENGLRHGADGGTVHVNLTPHGRLTVANDGPVVAGDILARLGRRFERAGATADGSGLGLAIVAAIAARLNSPFRLNSPRTGRTSGFEASVDVPILGASNVT